jgi:3'-phosphoadenosine 5'-phosphosulfate sulfotransferase (PAPS reductase)/FAD synthetase
MRRIRWFSCGAASAVATRIDIAEHGREAGPVVYCDTGAEHADNARFLRETAAWFDCEVETIRSDEYVDTWDVWERTGWINGPRGARCTGELKVAPRVRYQRPGDLHVVGFTVEERDRASQLAAQFFEVDWQFPLIDRGLTKNDTLAMVERAGIELPVMYRLGYRNNNCIACPKGGAGYWNRIRVDFPDHFARMADLSRRKGARLVQVTREGRRVHVFLDELRTGDGRHDEPAPSCSFMCAMAEIEIDGTW